MTYAIRPYRLSDGALPANLAPKAKPALMQVVVNVSDHACLFFRLTPNIGAESARYWFRLGQVVHASRELAIHTVSGTLILGNDLTGATELELSAVPGATASLKDATITIARHLAQLPRAVADSGAVLPVSVATLPGVRDGGGYSPFWQSLGVHFCGALPDDTQDPLWRARIASLLPRHPIYTSFLGEAGATALGAVHGDAMAMQEALLHAGFRRTNYVDVVDGGPVLEWA